MAEAWSFGRKLAAGFGIAVAFTGIHGFIAVDALGDVVAAKDAVIERDAGALLDAVKLDAAFELQAGALAGYLLTQQSRYVDASLRAQSQVGPLLRQLRSHVPGAQKDLDAMEAAFHDYTRIAQELIDMRTSGAPLDSVERAFALRVRPKREALERVTEAFVQRRTAALEAAKRDAADIASSKNRSVSLIAILAGILSALAAVVFARGLGKQLGSAVGRAAPERNRHTSESGRQPPALPKSG